MTNAPDVLEKKHKVMEDMTHVVVVTAINFFF
jgi:hypothetical protein